MRIISSFHDYYDIGMGLGHDNSISFIRVSKDVSLKTGITDRSPEDKTTLDLYKSLPHMPFLSSWDSLVIGVCGRFYPVLRYTGSSRKIVFCYSVEEVDNQMREVLSPKVLRESGYRNKRDIVKVFDTFKALKLPEAFIVNRSPIVVFNKTGKVATWNARLRDYNFERIISPYEAFQSIEMFLANLATPEKPIPPQNDLQKVQSHGFDKWSFRKGKI